jgi:hypothetical protein
MHTLVVHKALLFLHRPWLGHILSQNIPEPLNSGFGISFSASIASAEALVENMSSALIECPHEARSFWFFIFREYHSILLFMSRQSLISSINRHIFRCCRAGRLYYPSAAVAPCLAHLGSITSCHSNFCRMASRSSRHVRLSCVAHRLATPRKSPRFIAIDISIFPWWDHRRGTRWAYSRTSRLPLHGSGPKPSRHTTSTFFQPIATTPSPNYFAHVSGSLPVACLRERAGSRMGSICFVSPEPSAHGSGRFTRRKCFPG